MSKRWQLVLNVVVFIFVLAMIPFSIWASSFLNLRVSNTIRFDVEDIEGYFSYQITGNENPENNVTYASGNVFTASYNEENDKFILQNSVGDEVFDGRISLPGNGLYFSKDNTVITYTFLFVNSGENNVEIQVVSNSIAEGNLMANNVATAFKYETFLSDTDIIQQLPVFSAGAVSSSGKSFEVTVNKMNASLNTYTYVMLTYQLVLTNLATNSFSTAISLEINLHSVLN